MLSEPAPGAAAEARAARAALLGDDQVDRAIGADAKDVVVLADIRIGLAMLDVSTISNMDFYLSKNRFVCSLSDKSEGLLERSPARQICG